MWSSEDYVDFSTWSHAFKVSIPPEIARQTASAQTIKEWKVLWKLEVGLEHKPIQYVGDRFVKGFYLNIINHNAPSMAPPSPPSGFTIGADAYTTMVHATPSRGAFGPGDEIKVAVLAKPQDPGAITKKVYLVLERVVEYLEENSSPVPSSSGVSTATSKSFFRKSNSPRAGSDEPADMSTIATSVMEIFTQDNGSSRCDIGLTVPKRDSHWQVGETVQSKLVNVHFQLRVKVAIKSSKSRSSREFTCPPIPVFISKTSTADREHALSLIPELPVKAQRKSRTTRRGLYMHEGHIEISTEALTTTVPRKRSPSPFVPISVQGLKPILLSPQQSAQAQPQSISFVFPSPPPHASFLSPNGLPSLSNLFPANGMPANAPSPPDFESWSMIKQFQSTGRRISTTASEEEAMQPSRSRQRLVDDGYDGRPSLPSLDTLGLGLPHVARLPMRRPSTAPAQSSPFGSFSIRRSSGTLNRPDENLLSPIAAFSPSPPRPRTSFGSIKHGMSPPPFSQTAKSKDEEVDLLSPRRFAFSVKEDEERGDAVK